MDYLLGVDAGTTRIKAVLYALGGAVASEAANECSLSRPREGWVEQDPEELWEVVCATVRAAAGGIDRRYDRVLGLSLSTQGGTTIAVDAQLRPLRPAINWLDGRGASVIEDLLGSVGPDESYRLGGFRWSGYLAVAHIAWLRSHEPGLFCQTRRFLQVNDFLISRLAGRLCQDPSNAGITGLYNVLENRWEPRSLGAAGVRADQLSPIRPSGEPVGCLTAEAAERTGLTTEVLVMNGAHDQYAASLGAGAIEPGQVLLSCGTAWVVLVTMAEPVFGSGPNALAISRHSVPGRWGGLGSMAGVGTSVEWYVDNVLAPRSGYAPGDRGRAFAAMNEHLPAVPPGARGLLFLPIEGGHDRAAWGVGGLWGLRPSHTQDDIGRAVLEGIACELRWFVAGIEAQQVPIASFVMVGGASQSTCWPQIIADVTGRPVTVPAQREAGARGAALLAGIGLGLFDVRDGLRAGWGDDRAFEPRSDARRTYDGVFGRYQGAFRAFHRTRRTAPLP